MYTQRRHSFSCQKGNMVFCDFLHVESALCQRAGFSTVKEWNAASAQTVGFKV